MKKFGILAGHHFYDKNIRPFEHECFSYGDGGVSLSVSKHFRDRYDQIGMRFETLCLVMRSGVVRYDPETGKRLATYVAGEVDVLSGRRPLSGAGDITEELLLEVPQCFKNGVFHKETGSLVAAHGM
jgi:hypothetical protein